MQVIDIHTHFIPGTLANPAERFGGGDWPWLRRSPDGTGMLMLGDQPFRPVGPATWDVGRRLADMDRDGIDIQVISATPVFFCYGRPAEQTADFARMMNDAALEFCQAAPGRLLALAQVPLQDVDLACAEIDRAKANGMVGVQIGNHVGARDLNDHALERFLHHCADRAMPVLVHPWDMMGRDRVTRYMMPWLVGMPAETHLSILALILSGAFERLPARLKLCFAHGGGSFAFLLGRAENAWHHHAGVREHCPHPPSHYLNRFCVDSAVFDPRALRLLADTMGPDRILLGSDYPYPLGESRIGDLIRSTPGFSDADRTAMLGGNGAAWLNLPA